MEKRTYPKRKRFRPTMALEAVEALERSIRCLQFETQSNLDELHETRRRMENEPVYIGYYHLMNVKEKEKICQQQLIH